MQLSSAPLLEHLRIFHSRSAEETGAFLHAKDYRFGIARRQAGELDARLNGVYMPGVYLGYVQYGGAAVSLSPGGGRTDYRLHLPLRGHLHAMIDCDSVECDPCCGAIVSPERETAALSPSPTAAEFNWPSANPACSSGLACCSASNRLRRSTSRLR